MAIELVVRGGRLGVALVVSVATVAADERAASSTVGRLGVVFDVVGVGL